MDPEKLKSIFEGIKSKMGEKDDHIRRQDELIKLLKVQLDERITEDQIKKVKKTAAKRSNSKRELSEEEKQALRDRLRIGKEKKAAKLIEEDEMLKQLEEPEPEPVKQKAEPKKKESETIEKKVEPEKKAPNVVKEPEPVKAPKPQKPDNKALYMQRLMKMKARRNHY